MTDIARLPEANEKWFNDGMPSPHTLTFFNSISSLHAIISQGVIPVKVFSDLADIEGIIKNPLLGFTVQTEQGQAVYNGSNWVKSSDYQTLIT